MLQSSFIVKEYIIIWQHVWYCMLMCCKAISKEYAKLYGKGHDNTNSNAWQFVYLTVMYCNLQYLINLQCPLYQNISWFIAQTS